jgi:hypothetical protein
MESLKVMKGSGYKAFVPTEAGAGRLSLYELSKGVIEGLTFPIPCDRKLQIRESLSMLSNHS